MRLLLSLALIPGLFGTVGVSAADLAGMLRLSPANPHYLEWRGKPILLITSGEHYGAVVNLDFDYAKYLATLEAAKLNGTRVFLAYREQPTAFNIAGNSLAPKPDRFITPWIRSTTPGYFDGGNKFDLERWDLAYFERLRDFVKQAAGRGVVVEANLFSCFYSPNSWQTHPFHASNNINGIGQAPWDEVLTLKHPTLVAAQERYVRKVVEELRDFDNVYFEICNEPYIGGVSREWEVYMTAVVADAQKMHPHPKLISWNIANNTAKVVDPPAAVSIFNFHYAVPPEAVADNYALNRVIGDNETGFRGTNDAPYRMEAWDFIVAGGGLFNHLDYSFTAGFEGGNFVYPATQPGGGGTELRRQFGVLRNFIDGFDFVRMRPDNSTIVGGVPGSHTGRALAQPGRAYALYFRPSLITRFSVRWTGYIEVPATAEYTFYTVSNDGVRLWIDERPLINNWTDHSEKEDIGRISLQAGRPHPVKLEYFYNGGQAVMKLAWSRPGQGSEPIPATALLGPQRERDGLRGEYFAGPNFDRPWQTRTDAKVNFAWGTDSPFPLPQTGTPGPLELALPAGAWNVEWWDPVSGRVVSGSKVEAKGGRVSLAWPSLKDDLALRVLRP